MEIREIWRTSSLISKATLKHWVMDVNSRITCVTIPHGCSQLFAGGRAVIGLLTLLIESPNEPFAQSLRLCGIRMGEHYVNVVALQFASSVTVVTIKNRGYYIHQQSTHPPTMVDTQPGSMSLSSCITTRPISSTSSRGILEYTPLECAQIMIFRSHTHLISRSFRKPKAILIQVSPRPASVCLPKLSLCSSSTSWDSSVSSGSTP